MEHSTNEQSTSPSVFGFMIWIADYKRQVSSKLSCCYAGGGSGEGNFDKTYVLPLRKVGWSRVSKGSLGEGGIQRLFKPASLDWGMDKWMPHTLKQPLIKRWFINLMAASICLRNFLSVCVWTYLCRTCDCVTWVGLCTCLCSCVLMRAHACLCVQACVCVCPSRCVCVS